MNCRLYVKKDGKVSVWKGLIKENNFCKSVEELESKGYKFMYATRIFTKSREKVKNGLEK